MAVDYIKSLNAGSGLNTTEIIDALITAERQPAADQITSAREEKTVSISSLGKLKQTLSTSQTGITAVEGTTGLTLENSGTAIGMTITDTSIARSFTNAVEVNQLAKAQTLVFSGFTSPTETVGTGSLGFSFGTWTNNSFSANSDRTTKTITLSAGADSLTNLKDAINAAGMDVTASIVKTTGTNYSLMIKSREGAAHAMRIAASADDGSSKLANINFTTNVSGNAIEQVAARNATMKLDGVSIIRETNTVSDLIQGVTLELKSTTTVSGGDTLSAKYKEDTALTAFKSLVTNINTLITELTSMTSRGGGSTAQKGEMPGDPFLTAQLRTLKKLTTTPINGFGSSPAYMTTYGVETQLDGTLKINEKKFKAAYVANPDGFAAIMDTRVTTTNSQITGSISGADFTPGSYPLVVSGGTATIDGIGMGKSGTTYTNGIGTTRGLSLNFAGTDASATVYIGRSVAQSVIDFTTEMLKTSGKIETKISTLNTGIADDDLELTKLDERMDTVRSRYVSRFSAMEAVSNQMRQTGEALTNMMDAWRSSLDN